MTGILSLIVDHPLVALVLGLLAALGVEVARRRRAQAKLARERQAALVRAVEAGEATRRAERVEVEMGRTGLAREVVEAQIAAVEAARRAQTANQEANAVAAKHTARKGFRWPTR